MPKSLPNSPEQRRSALKWSFWDAAFTAIMVGTAETFALAFAVKRGVSATELAWLSTFPVLLGSLTQWVLPFLVRFERLKATILIAHLIQILGLVILCLSVKFEPFVPILMLGLSLYWIGGMMSAPLWLDWVAPWLPHRYFSRYLSRRNAFMSLWTVVAYILTALAVHRLTGLDAFGWAFVVATAARLSSWAAVLKQASPPTKHTAFATWLAPPRLRASKPVLIMLAVTVVFKFGVHIASPFFIPYMFTDLKFTLMQYVLMSSVPFIGRFLFLARWGEVARSLQPFVGLQLALFGISAMPVLWTVSSNLIYLSVVEIASGVVWGAFELCTVLIVQNYWPGSARRLLGVHLTLMNLVALAGASLGSYWIHQGKTYSDLFVISSNIRFLVAMILVFLLAWVGETRRPLKVYGDFLATVLALGPSMAGLGRIIPLRRPRKKG